LRGPVPGGNVEVVTKRGVKLTLRIRGGGVALSAARVRQACGADPGGVAAALRKLRAVSLPNRKALAAGSR
jgi:hypothetical protein